MQVENKVHFSDADEPDDDYPRANHEGDNSRPLELAVVLRDMRKTLLQNDVIASAIKQLSADVSSRDLYFSLIFLATGIGGQAYAVTSAPWLIPVFFFSYLVGMAGLMSLTHESWHLRSHRNRKVDRWLSRWVYTPFLLSDQDAQMKAHKAHHRMPGEPEDPNNVTWAKPWPEFRNKLLGLVLVFPAVFLMLKFLITGQRADQNYQDTSHRASPRLWLAIALVHIPWALGLLWVSPWAFLFGYLLPQPFAAAVGSLREYREHARLPDGTTAVYDHRCSAAQRLLIPGGFFNYHTLHHIFPEVPQRSLPKLYEILAANIDMNRDFYGRSPQVGLKYSYLNGEVAA